MEHPPGWRYFQLGESAARRGAAEAGGGVCWGGQSRRVFAAEPHMFTGSIPPVEPQLGGSRPWTGSRISRIWIQPDDRIRVFSRHSGGQMSVKQRERKSFDVCTSVLCLPSRLFTSELPFCSNVCGGCRRSCASRPVRVFPPSAELAGSSVENKQVERRKIARR